MFIFKLIKKLNLRARNIIFNLSLGLITLFLVTIIIPAIVTLPLQSLAVAQIAATPTLLEQGRTFYESGRFTEAANLWQQAVEMYKNQGDRRKIAISSSYLCLAYQDLGAWEKAQQAIAQSLAILQPQRNLDVEEMTILAQVLNTQGNLQLAMGKAQNALTTWQQAENIYTQIGDKTGKLGNQINQAQALQSLGLYRRAWILLQQVNEQLQKQPNSQLKATGLRSLGVVLQVIGDLTESKKVFQQSLTITQQLNLPIDTSLTLFSLGNTQRGLQDFKGALSSYQQAAKSSNPLTRLEAEINQLSLLVDTKQLPAAQSLLAKIQPQLTSFIPNRRGVYAQVNLAESLIKMSTVLDKQRLAANSTLPITTYQNIAQILAVAVRQATDLQDARAKSYALGQLGRLYEQNQQLLEAEDLTQQALVLAQASNADDISYRWQWQLGRILKRNADLLPTPRPDNVYNTAIAAYTEAVNTLKSLRGDLLAINTDAQFSFKEKIEPIYRELVELLVSNAKPSQENLKQARKVIESLQLAELENFFRSSCLDAKPQQIDKIDKTAAIIYPIMLPERLVMIVSLPEEPLQYYTKLLPQSEVEDVIDQLLESLNPAFANEEQLRLTQKMYDWLIRPAEKLLANHPQIKTLVFIPDGYLRNVPMATLHDGKQYLVEKYSTALTPGLQLLATPTIKKQHLEVFMGGLTEARQGFTALPGVKTELAQIATKVSSKVLLNQQFTAKNLESGIDKTTFPLIHLATHGQFSSNPEETFILTWDNRLSIQDFYTLIRSRTQGKLQPIELIILSACQTAAGDKKAILGLAGLAVRSGARSTVASLWSVNDKSTALLMTEFYKNLVQQSGINKSEALRQAQLTLLKSPEYKHPFYWAAFILVGNWL